jgi:prevent-host-death family protein
MVRTVNVHEAKTTLSKLLEKVAAGERVVIAKSGKPVADLVPHVRTDISFGTAEHLIEFDSDTFDDPVPEVSDLFQRP